VTNTPLNLRLIAPAHAPDSLSEGVVAALTRKVSPRLYWGPIKTALLGLISGGLLPLILLPWRFREFINAEQNQLWHFAEWLRLQYPSSESERFQEGVSKLRFRKILWVLSLLLAACAVAWAWHDLVPLARRPVVLLEPLGPVVQLPSLVPVTPRFLFSFTARLPAVVRQFATVPRVLIAAEGFMLLLIAAHLLSLWQVMLHTVDVRNVAGLFEKVAKLIECKMMPIVRAHAISGHARINTEDELLDDPLALRIMIDVFSERGFHATVDIHKMEVPERINPDTWEIICRTKKVYRIEIRYQPSDIRRGH